jgi:hypothetical protein
MEFDDGRSEREESVYPMVDRGWCELKRSFRPREEMLRFLSVGLDEGGLKRNQRVVRLEKKECWNYCVPVING